MNDQSFSSDFFNEAKDVRTFAHKRVSDFIAGQYPSLNALDESKRGAIVDDCAADLAEAILKKIDAAEPIDLLLLSSDLIRKFLTKRGFKPTASAEGTRGKDKRINPRRVRPNDHLPTIRITENNREEIVSDSERALIAACRGVYQRGGKIVSAMSVEVPAAHGRQTIAQQIREKGDFALVEDLSSAAHFEKWDANSKGFVLVDPPIWIVKTLRERDRLRLPALTGVTNAPTMRHDGTILSTPGYDKQGIRGWRVKRPPITHHTHHTYYV